MIVASVRVRAAPAVPPLTRPECGAQSREARRQFAGEAKRPWSGQRWPRWGAAVNLPTQRGTWSRQKQEPNMVSASAEAGQFGRTGYAHEPTELYDRR